MNCHRIPTLGRMGERDGEVGGGREGWGGRGEVGEGKVEREAFFLAMGIGSFLVTIIIHALTMSMTA